MRHDIDLLKEEALRRRARRLREKFLQDFGDGDDEAEEPEELEPFMEGFEGLGDASGLDTTPDLDFESPSGIPSADSSAHHVMVHPGGRTVGPSAPH